MRKERVDFFDTVRAICCLWIVAVWHIEPYLKPPVFSIHNEYTEYITIGVLATFTFISGFFLGGSISSVKETVVFYKRRIQRFYPLFLLSCISFYVYHLIGYGDFIVSLKQLFFTATGLACFTNSMPLTIWFFSMLIFFYAITPLMASLNSVRGKGILALCIYLALAIIHYIFKTDNRVLLYFPFYCFGLIIYGKSISQRFHKRAFVGAIIGSITSIIFNVMVYSNFIIQLLPAFFLLVCIIEISKIVTKKYTKKLFGIISYSSMCVYLFHRQFLGLIELLFGDLPAVIIYGIILPVLLLCCYLCQKVYDLCPVSCPAKSENTVSK